MALDFGTVLVITGELLLGALVYFVKSYADEMKKTRNDFTAHRLQSMVREEVMATEIKNIYTTVSKIEHTVEKLIDKL